MTLSSVRFVAVRLALLPRAGFVVGLVGLFGLLAPRALAAPAPDDWLTTKAKIALLTTSHLESNAVHVDTNDGRVTLYGKVVNREQWLKAEATVKAISGVKAVRNLLQVVPESHEKAVGAADSEAGERVTKALAGDPGLAGSHVRVKSVNNGAVLLAGTAKDLFEYLRAVELASDVPGVHSVESEIKSAANPRDFERSFVSGTENVALDGWITTSTKMRLLADARVPALDISVDTHLGTVTLFGIVSSAAARDAAEADTRKVTAVIGVSNELQVVSKEDKADVVIEDAIVKITVKKALGTDPSFKHVDVDVKNGVARLTGNVATTWQRLRAATLARAARGVRSIDDDIHLQHS